MPCVSHAEAEWAAAKKAWGDMEAELDASPSAEKPVSSAKAAEPVWSSPARACDGASTAHPTLSYKDLLQRPAAAVAMLESSGYMVVTDVCSKAEALCHLDAISREHDSALLMEHRLGAAVAVPGAKGCSLLKRHGFAYMKSVQDCRTTIGKDRVAKVFAALLSTGGTSVGAEELVMSCDAIAWAVNGVTATRMGVTKELRENAHTKWLADRQHGSTLRMHTDIVPGSKGDRYQQQLGKAGFLGKSLQSCLNLMETTVSSPTFVCAEMNSKELAELQKRIRTDGSKDLYSLTPRDISDFKICERFRYVDVPAGSLTLWKSELPHSNSRGDPRAHKNLPPSEPSRCGVMMCFGPRVLQNEQELSKKLAMAAKGWSHDHWPCHASGNGNNFRGLGSNFNKFKDSAAVALTNAQQRLLGSRKREADTHQTDGCSNKSRRCQQKQ
jgi:hypothetical protein|eukprot:COSAG02_NODE_5125_length_4609_cov_3.134590_2_plen_441_part_00